MKFSTAICASYIYVNIMFFIVNKNLFPLLDDFNKFAVWMAALNAVLIFRRQVRN